MRRKAIRSLAPVGGLRTNDTIRVTEKTLRKQCPNTEHGGKIIVKYIELHGYRECGSKWYGECEDNFFYDTYENVDRFLQKVCENKTDEMAVYKTGVWLFKGALTEESKILMKLYGNDIKKLHACII